MKLIGVDGCRGGWLLAYSDAALSPPRLEITTDLAGVFRDAWDGKTRVVIDVPIDLSENRRCDLAARALLGPRRSSSVFPAPCRPVLGATAYPEACALSVGACGKRISRQLFGILPKIAAVDALMTTPLQCWVREAHPEVTFALLAGAGRGPTHSKKTPEGEAERLSLLCPYLGPVDVTAERARLGAGRVSRDDIVDALACLVTAHRIEQGHAQVLPDGPVPLDSKGLRMEIVA